MKKEKNILNSISYEKLETENSTIKDEEKSIILYNIQPFENNSKSIIYIKWAIYKKFIFF